MAFCLRDSAKVSQRHGSTANTRGGKPTARANAAEVIKLDVEGLQRTEIARRTGIGIASVYRILADAKKVAGNRKVVA